MLIYRIVITWVCSSLLDQILRVPRSDTMIGTCPMECHQSLRVIKSKILIWTSIMPIALLLQSTRALKSTSLLLNYGIDSVPRSRSLAFSKTKLTSPTPVTLCLNRNQEWTTFNPCLSIKRAARSNTWTGKIFFWKQRPKPLRKRECRLSMSLAGFKLW